MGAAAQSLRVLRGWLLALILPCLLYAAPPPDVPVASSGAAGRHAGASAIADSDSLSLYIEAQLAILRGDPSALVPHLRLGEAFFRIGNDVSARHHLETFLARTPLGPDSLRAALLEARVLLRLGLHRRAARMLRYLAARPEGPPGASHDYSLLLREDGFRVEALMAEMRAAEHSGADSVFMREALAQWKELQHPEEALQLSRRLIQGGSGCAEDLFQCGYLNQLLDHAEPARLAYAAALELDPRDPETHFNLALLLDQAGEVDSAAAHLWKVIGLRPAYDPAYFELSEILLRAGRKAEAAGALRRYLLAGSDSVAKVEAGSIVRSLEDPAGGE
jgi:tetratricopeptide (TPR) repeat protein